MATTRADCVGMLKNGGISEQEAIQIVDMTLAEKKRIQAEGRLATAADLAAFGNTQAERMRQAAQAQRKHAALNVLVRKDITDHMEKWVGAGGDRVEGLLAYLVGSPKQIEGARASIGAQIMANRGDWVGGLMAKLEQVPGTIKLIERDRNFGGDVVREMHQLKPDGKPGITGDELAQGVAWLFSEYSEMARVRQNEAGAFIGKLEGWVPQSHDEAKLVAAGRDAWREAILPLLDKERSFEGKTAQEIDATLNNIFENIITGLDGSVSAREKGEFTTPRNLASSLGQHRELHFKDADAQIAYNDKFGSGNALGNIIQHLDSASRRVAIMERLGPNPETMLVSTIEEMKRMLREDMSMEPEAKAKAVKDLSGAWDGGGMVKKAFDVITGNSGHTVHRQWASIFSGARAMISMSKLGGIFLSQFNDLVTHATNYRYMGRNLLEGYLDGFGAILKGRGDAEQRQMAMHLGSIYDGILGDVMARFNAEDVPVHGAISKAMNTFFKLTGMNFWTDSLKGGYVRGLSTWIGEQVGKEFHDLDGPLRAVFSYHGIDEPKWNAMRHMVHVAEDGKTYVVPHLADQIPEEALRPLAAERLDAAAKSVTDPDKLAFHEAFLLKKEREKLRSEVMSFFIDETAHAVLEPDFRTRAYMTQGQRPATVLGEAMRFAMQFKSFPAAFTQKILWGQRFGVAGEKGFDVPGAIQFAVGSMLFGYASMTAKDFFKGKLPRDPANWETWTAAALQSGGLGIYGDYLFAQQKGFGGGAIPTLAGPAAGIAENVITMAAKAIHGDFDAGDLVKLATDNTPYINMFYTRAAIDYLFLYHVREMLSPGTLRRMERKAKQNYNQEFIVPPSQVIQRGGGFR